MSKKTARERASDAAARAARFTQHIDRLKAYRQALDEHTIRRESRPSQPPLVVVNAE